MRYKKHSILVVPLLLFSINIFSNEQKISKNSIILSKLTSPILIDEVKLDVPLISQKPELYNGCEVTSLAILLKYKGIDIDKLTLASEIRKDITPMIKDKNGQILIWGNPKLGFVGDVTGINAPGYSIDPNQLLSLAENHYEGEAIDLTNSTLEDLQRFIMVKCPVVVWMTCSMTLPKDFITWKDGQGNPVKATFMQHAVLLTGYDKDNFYYNDPLSNLKNASISKENFNKVWEAMGKKALTIR